MAGGLFGRPFVLNEKCIIFSLICMALFLYKPSFKSNFSLYLTLFIIFVLSYVAMAWYDFYFNCDIVPLKRGTHSLTGKFKPPAHQKDKQINDKETDIDKSRRHILIYLSHIIFIVPLLLYIAYYQHKVKPFIYSILIALSMFTLIYHGGAMLQGSHNL